MLRAAPAATFDRSALLESLNKELTAHYSLADALEIDLLRSWTAPVPPAGATEVPMTVTIIEYPEALASSMLVRVRYLQEKSILREDTLALRATVWRDAVVTAAPIDRGDSVSLQVVETRRVDTLRERDSLSLSAAGADYVFSRAMPAGRLITWRDVARRSLVQRGQMVEVSASDGSLMITMKALAMQDGARGDSVRVRNLESKREFVAKVTAENRAEVRF